MRITSKMRLFLASRNQVVPGQVPYLPSHDGRFSAHFVATCLRRTPLLVVTRNKCIAPKQRRIERLPSGYAVREFYNNPGGQYWYVITALEVVRAKKRMTSQRRSGESRTD